MIVDCAAYEGGVRQPGALALADALETAHRCENGFVWIGLHEPTMDEFDAVAREFELHPLAVEDSVKAQQRAKAERYGDSLFVVLKAANFEPDADLVQLSQLMLFIGKRFIIVVRHGNCAIPGQVRSELEANPERLAFGPYSVLHAIADRVVDGYDAVLHALVAEVQDVEASVFSDVRDNHAERIYRLKREVLEFRTAVDPVAEVFDQYVHGQMTWVPEPLRPYFRDIYDHAVRESERVSNLDSLLGSALSANLAQVGVRQNEDMRKISAWVAILAVPTMIAGVYGMNFDHMPELEKEWGYPAVLALMAVACTVLYRKFKSSGWL